MEVSEISPDIFLTHMEFHSHTSSLVEPSHTLDKHTTHTHGAPGRMCVCVCVFGNWC